MNRRPLDVTYTNRMEYAHAWDVQKDIVGKLDAGEARETLMLLQHPPTYTIGSQRHPEHLLLTPEQLKAQGISVFQIDRGGRHYISWAGAAGRISPAYAGQPEGA